MKSITQVMSCVVVLTLALQSSAHAGGWTQQKGKSYFQLSVANFFTRNEFGLQSMNTTLFSGIEGVSDGSFLSNSLFLYGEFGVTDDITLVVSTAVQSVQIMYLEERMPSEAVSRNLSSTGPADVRVLARYKLASTEAGVFSIQSGIKIPTGLTKSAVAFSTGKVDLEAYLQFGRSIEVFNAFGYFTAEGGYRLRLGDGINDEATYLLEIGIPLLDQVNLKLNFSHIINLGQISLPPPGGGLINNFNLGRLTAGLSYLFSSTIGVSCDVSHDLFGRNIIRGNTFSVGIFFK